jgi:MFS family permease
MNPTRTHWGTLVLLILTGIIAAFQVGKAAVAVPALMSDLGLSLVSASWIVGAYGALGTLIALPAGLLMSLLPARPTLIAGLVAIGAGSIAGAFMENSALLITTRVFEGCGFLAVILSAPRLFRLVTTAADSQLAFVFWGTYMPAGSAVMMLAGPFLIAAFGWQGLWLINGLLPLAYALIVSRLDIPGADAHQSSNRNLFASIREGLRSGPMLVAVAFGAYTLQYFALSSLLPALLVDRLGLSIEAAGTISAGAVLANAVGNLFAGIALRMGVPLWIVLLAGFATSGTLAFGIFNESTPITTVAFLAAGTLAITGLIPASLFAAMPVVAPTSATLAIALGMLTQIGISGQLLGPTVLAAFVERFGWPQAPYFFLTVMVAGIAIALGLRFAMQRKARAT